MAVVALNATRRLQKRHATVTHPIARHSMERHEEEQSEERQCEECGASLAGKRSDAKYCSKVCRQKAYRRRKREELERLRSRDERRSLWQRLRDWLR